ncbi:hypothetical protein A3K73_03780 [Candidatus Pacearchaeota archaeon RBG_13_36_9]|nr:MAG: hypothetical protein A3K73_03780 [Candidatus Pacearchaeota archaeon RBG_13_36_9]
MAIFGKTNKPTEATNYRPSGIPKKYLCTAKYTIEYETRYLIRELISPLNDQDLKRAVIDIFLKDLESPAITKRLDKEAENEQDRREKRLIYLRGKLEDLVIEELKQTEAPAKK